MAESCTQQQERIEETVLQPIETWVTQQSRSAATSPVTVWSAQKANSVALSNGG